MKYINLFLIFSVLILVIVPVVSGWYPIYYTKFVGYEEPIPEGSDYFYVNDSISIEVSVSNHTAICEEYSIGWPPEDDYWTYQQAGTAYQKEYGDDSVELNWSDYSYAPHHGSYLYIGVRCAGYAPVTYGYLEINATCERPPTSPPVAGFTFSPASGNAPLLANFTDTSTNATSWLWSFGDGNTSADQHPQHTFAYEGNFKVNLTVVNYLGSDSAEAWINVSSAAEPPVADFEATPTSDTRPLTVQFTDTSTGSPTEWAWDFTNDGSIDTFSQNPQYVYNESGSYTIKLIATNSEGNDTEIKYGYITVAGNYYIYADGVGLYFDSAPQSPLYPANHTPIFFYNRIVGQQGGNPLITWQGVGNPVDNATGSRNWNKNEDANSKANFADFALHAGHGWDNGFKFGTENTSFDINREDLSFGGNYGRAKWVALFTCSGLKESTHENWESVFNGLHILMGFDTTGLLTMDQGTQLADRMMGNGTYYKDTILDAWENTLTDTIEPNYIKGAYMYAFPSQNDYLPGFGTFKQPEKDGNGNYNISYRSFNCS